MSKLKKKNCYCVALFLILVLCAFSNEKEELSVLDGKKEVLRSLTYEEKNREIDKIEDAENVWKESGNIILKLKSPKEVVFKKYTGCFWYSPVSGRFDHEVKCECKFEKEISEKNIVIIACSNLENLSKKEKRVILINTETGSAIHNLSNSDLVFNEKGDLFFADSFNNNFEDFIDKILVFKIKNDRFMGIWEIILREAKWVSDDELEGKFYELYSNIYKEREYSEFDVKIKFQEEKSVFSKKDFVRIVKSSSI